MAKEYLGEFEELVLTLVAALQDDAYGAAITDEIETKFKREVNLSAVHVTLYRLEDKGYIKSKMGGGTSERGRQAKKNFYHHKCRYGDVTNDEGNKAGTLEDGSTAQNVPGMKRKSSCP